MNSRIISAVILGISIISAPAFGETDSAAKDTATPVPFSSSLSPILKPVVLPRVRDDRRVHLADYALYGGIAAYRTLDFTSTRHALNTGNGKEDILPQFVVNNTGVFVAFEALATAGEVSGSVFLIHHGHRKLARLVNAVSIGVGVPTDIHNYSIKPR